jgi:hypothetical protein
MLVASPLGEAEARTTGPQIDRLDNLLVRMEN